MRVIVFVAIVLSWFPLAAQPNSIRGVDGALTEIGSLTPLRYFPLPWRVLIGAYSKMCNEGTVPIYMVRTLRQDDRMDPRRAWAGLIIAREMDGGFEQISNRAFVRNMVYASNLPCPACVRPPLGYAQLGIGCWTQIAAQNSQLPDLCAPPDEIDPWSGAWNPVGSFFDRGYPEVPPPYNTDGVQSRINDDWPLPLSRLIVHFDELQRPGARYFCQGMFVVIGEPELEREDNLRSREFVASGPIDRLVFSNVGAGTSGTVLKQWSGATVGSGSNGQADGRIYVGVKVTGPVDGVYRYHYAMHNRDNHHGAASLRVPACLNHSAANFYFHDVDQDASNDWAPSTTATEVAFLAGQNNSLKWNEIYSFAFDTTQAPTIGDVTIDQALPVQGGAQTITVGDVLIPGFDANTDLGPGCGIPAAPVLATLGSPDQPRIPNPTFGLSVSGLGSLNQVFINASFQSTNLDLGNGCKIFTDPNSTILIGQGIADSAGSYSLPLPVPDNASLEGIRLTFQAVEAQTNGRVLNSFDVSNGIEIRIGNDCP